MRQKYYIKWKDPNDELTGLAAWVRRKLADNSELAASDIYFAVPNRSWAKACKKALAERKLSSTVLMDGPGLTIPTKDPGRSAAYVAWLRLRLLVDAGDTETMTAWRALGQSSEQERIAQEFVTANAHKRGFSLVKAVAAGEPNEEFAQLIDPVVGDEEPKALLARVQQRIAEPQFLQGDKYLRICTYARLLDYEPRILILPGLVDGLIPVKNLLDPDSGLTIDERQAGLDKARRLFGTALGKGDMLLLSSFKQVEKERGEAMGLVFARFKDEHGTTMGMLRPSMLLAEAGDAIPASTSGQQFLQETDGA